MNEQLEKFYRESYKKKVRSIGRTLTYNKNMAEDIVQEAFCRAIQYWQSFDAEKGNINSWFNKILYNTMREFQADASQELSISGEFDTTQVEVLLQNEIRKVDNPVHREILFLFYVLGYTSKQISDIIPSVSQTNVTTISSRFKNRFRNDTRL